MSELTGKPNFSVRFGRVFRFDFSLHNRSNFISSCFVSLFCFFAIAALATPTHAEMVPLVEITYELDLTPFEGRPTSDFEIPSDDPFGYYLRTPIGEQTRVLYSAMGADFERSDLRSQDDGSLLIALRYINYIDGPEGSDKYLQAAKLPYSPDFGTPSGIAPAFDFSVTQMSGTGITVFAGNIVRDIEIGNPVVVAKTQNTLSMDEFADAVLASYVDAGVPTPPTRDRLMQQARLFARGQENITLYARLTVQNYGEVNLSNIDLALLWRDARNMAYEGPYDQAADALETMLDILPDHAEAERLFLRTLDLIDAGAIPAKLTGILKFPGNQPDDGIRALWDLSNEGFAVVSPASASSGSGAEQLVILVRDGQFFANLFSGNWKLTVYVPGFEKFEVQALLQDDEVINVPLILSE